MLLPSVLLSALALPAGDTCSASKAVAAGSGHDIIETAIAAGSFTTLAKALTAAELVEPLQGEGPFTVFAPTDDAFAKLPKGELARLLDPDNRELLRAILTYHVVPANLPAKKVVSSPNAASLNGQRIDFETTDAGVKVEDATVLKTDIECSNGVIHVIDSVILPSTIDIVETAVAAGSFETLATALSAAGLVEALKAEGPFTVFAPTDEAFAALPEGALAGLLEPANREKLSAILTFHVVPGRIYSDAVAAGASFETLQGQKLTSRKHEDNVLVQDARIVNADIETSNGVIHVIDSVLMPK